MQTRMMIPISRCKEPAKDKTWSEGWPENFPYPADWAVADLETAPARYSVREILQKGFAAFKEKHQVPFYKEKVVNALMACGTGELGYTLSECSECGMIQMHADTCGNRNCPSCGFLKKLKWIEERNADLLEGVPYVHVVFTVPHDLNSLIFQNQKLLINHLFHTVKKTVLDLCQEEYNLVPGMMMVLHTFSSNLTLHYHIHMLATAAGLSPDKKSFAVFGSNGYFLPEEVLRTRYRANFLEGLKDYKESGEISCTGDAAKFQNSYEWQELIDTCYQKNWNIEIRKYAISQTQTENSRKQLTARDFPGYAIHPSVSPGNLHEETAPKPEIQGNEPDAPEASIVNSYLSEYAFRTAITDNRIKSWNDDTVVFEYKNYHDGECRKDVMHLSIEEFIRRFLLHILEPGIQRIRYAGFLASCIRKKAISLIRDILCITHDTRSPVSYMTAAELIHYFTGVDLMECPLCHSQMQVWGRGIKNPALAAKSVNRFFMIPEGP